MAQITPVKAAAITAAPIVVLGTALAAATAIFITLHGTALPSPVALPLTSVTALVGGALGVTVPSAAVAAGLILLGTAVAAIALALLVAAIVGLTARNATPPGSFAISELELTRKGNYVAAKSAAKLQEILRGQIRGLQVTVTAHSSDFALVSLKRNQVSRNFYVVVNTTDNSLQFKDEDDLDVIPFAISFSGSKGEAEAYMASQK